MIHKSGLILLATISLTALGSSGYVWDSDNIGQLPEKISSDDNPNKKCNSLVKTNVETFCIDIKDSWTDVSLKQSTSESNTPTGLNTVLSIYRLMTQNSEKGENSELSTGEINSVLAQYRCYNNKDIQTVSECSYESKLHPATYVKYSSDDFFQLEDSEVDTGGGDGGDQANSKHIYFTPEDGGSALVNTKGEDMEHKISGDSVSGKFVSQGRGKRTVKITNEDTGKPQEFTGTGTYVSLDNTAEFGQDFNNFYRIDGDGAKFNVKVYQGEDTSSDHIGKAAFTFSYEDQSGQTGPSGGSLPDYLNKEYNGLPFPRGKDALTEKFELFASDGGVSKERTEYRWRLAKGVFPTSEPKPGDQVDFQVIVESQEANLGNGDRRIRLFSKREGEGRLSGDINWKKKGGHDCVGDKNSCKVYGQVDIKQSTKNVKFKMVFVNKKRYKLGPEAKEKKIWFVDVPN
jgi:hypothetical protein